MVNLEYIKNPFTDDYLYSFECFRNEKKFYDCVARKIVDCNDVFENLGSSFYTYLLTGNNNEWIGYVLFHNSDLINGYIKNIEVELRKLLLRLKEIICDVKIIETINLLLKELNNHEFSSTVCLNELEDKIKFLHDSCIKKNEKSTICFSEYYANVFNYLYNFNEYYYLDIVIGLPLDTKINEIELRYYGFIKEVYSNIEKLVKEKFKDIPIVLKNTDSELWLINNEQQKTKVLDKKDIA